MATYAEELRALGPADVVQVVPSREAHRTYVQSINETVSGPHETADQGPAMPAGSHPLVDHGGSIIAHVRLVLVYLGPWWGNRADLEAFTRALVEDGYLDKLQAFGIGRGTFFGGIQGPAIAAAGASVTDAQIQDAIKALLAVGTLPAADGNTLYVVCLPDGVAVDMGGGSMSCEKWCGYHSAIDATTFYAVEPATTCGACSQGDAMGAFTAVLSHEIAEAVTDAFPGRGWFVDDHGDPKGPYNGWETGDMAAWPDPPLQYGRWKVQGYWTGDKADLGHFAAPAPPQPFAASLPFWQWLEQYHPDIIKAIEAADPVPEHKAIFGQWIAWFHANGYDGSEHAPPAHA